jgi:hypothetical protein
VGEGGAPARRRAVSALSLTALPALLTLLALVSVIALGALPRAAAAQSSLGSGTLLVAGTTLAVSPESQTVPFDTPTIVHTTLQGYDTTQGTLPADLRVVGDFTGPEIDGVLELATVPNEPFRIPRLSLKGQYRLDNIRLEQAGVLLAYAEPRSAAILVTQILVTRVTSRPLTLEEIRSHGIIVDGSSTRAYNFTFGFGIEGQTFDYNVPIVYWYPRDHFGPPQVRMLGGGGGNPRFHPPQMAPFTLTLRPRNEPQAGGCANPEGCEEEEMPPLPGVILFPTDLSLLHQFFSVVLMATNGAPAGDVLTIRDLTAKIRLPAGLRQARTEPPTTLGTPVPMRVPGPDGELGTADDLTFLVAQATAEAEFLVEGLREGTHIVDFDLEGVLEGMPTGIRRIEGTARGAVVVRDPTLGVVVSHPDVVRADEEYTMEVSVTNNGVTPANLVSLALPPSQLAGVVVVGDNRRTIDSILPGESDIVEFRLRPLLTGSVIASFVRADNHITELRPPRRRGRGGDPAVPDRDRAAARSGVAAAGAPPPRPRPRRAGILTRCGAGGAARGPAGGEPRAGRPAGLRARPGRALHRDGRGAVRCAGGARRHLDGSAGRAVGVGRAAAHHTARCARGRRDGAGVSRGGGEQGSDRGVRALCGDHGGNREGGASRERRHRQLPRSGEPDEWKEALRSRDGSGSHPRFAVRRPLRPGRRRARPAGAAGERRVSRHPAAAHKRRGRPLDSHAACRRRAQGVDLAERRAQ